MSHYTRLIIGEAISEVQVREFARVWKDQAKATQANTPGLVSASLDIEEGGGNMVIVTMIFADRQSCIMYHSSRDYRKLVASTQHLIIGNFVIKLFKREAKFENSELLDFVRNTALIVADGEDYDPETQELVVQNENSLEKETQIDEAYETLRKVINQARALVPDVMPCFCDGTLDDPANVSCPRHHANATQSA